MREIYKIGELRQVISEESNKNEFKPVFGPKVPEENKKINDTAYKESTKRTSDYDGKVKIERSESKPVMPVENKGMSDLKYDAASKEFKNKVKSQLKGYTSAENEKLHKNDEFGNSFFRTDKDIEPIEKSAKEKKELSDKTKTLGLSGRMIPKKEFEKQNTTAFNESKMIKRLNFKKTNFLSESHMLSKVPDDYKIEGNKFIMNDANGENYLVEWHDNGKAIVEKQVNKKKINEELDRIKELYSYKYKESYSMTDSKMRVNEENNFSNMLGKVRGLSK